MKFQVIGERHRGDRVEINRDCNLYVYESRFPADILRDAGRDVQKRPQR